MTVSIDQQFIEYIVKSVVGNPGAVSIKRTIDEKGVLLELTVDPEDLGRVIGKRGATAQSLRTLLRALGTKNDARYNLKIVDVGDPRPPKSDDDKKANKRDEPNDSDAEQGEEESTAADDQTVTDELDETTEDENTTSENEDNSHSDLASRTRAELAELDDLDL